MRRHLALVALALAVGCRSPAPYTVPAAAINTGLAVGAALGQRSAGGCYATCSHGTVCNPRTGLCESATAAEVCDQGETGTVRCVPVMCVGVSRSVEVAALGVDGAAFRRHRCGRPELAGRVKRLVLQHHRAGYPTQQLAKQASR